MPHRFTRRELRTLEDDNTLPTIRLHQANDTSAAGSGILFGIATFSFRPTSALQSDPANASSVTTPFLHGQKDRQQSVEPFRMHEAAYSERIMPPSTFNALPFTALLVAINTVALATSSTVIKR